MVVSYVGAGSGGAAGVSQSERYVHHAAGVGGFGGSSYIDSVVLRDRDLVNGSPGAEDAAYPFEERTYILQNWRADVVATTRASGEVIEKIQYTPYGSALTHLLTFTARADFDSSGGVDGADVDAFLAAWANSEPSADVDQSGGVDGDDTEFFYTLWANGSNQEYYETQPGACQTTAVRFGYAGYVRDASVNNGGDVSTYGERNYSGAMAGLYHVRHRVYDPEMGRWTRRDQIGYVDGPNVYEYVRGLALGATDPTGLFSEIIIRCRSIKGLPASHCWIERKGDVCGGHPKCAWPNSEKCNELGPWGPIVVPCQAWEKSRDKEIPTSEPFDMTTPIKCPEGTDYEAVWNCVLETAKKIEACKIKYFPTGPNSNSTLKAIYQRCVQSRGCSFMLTPLGGEPRTTDGKPAIGWDSDLGDAAMARCLEEANA